MSDYRFWWVLFVFFAALSVAVLQRRYRRWQQAKRASRALPEPERSTLEHPLRVEGWRLLLMAGSIASMTGLVFAALMGAPPTLLLPLRLAAVASVLGVVVLSWRR